MVFARRAGEHNIIYQYYLDNARDHYMGLIQTETVRAPTLLRSL